MTTKERTDTHRPSAIEPADYTYLDSMDLEWGLGPADRGEGGLYELRERHDNAESAPYRGQPGRCDHCGAHLRYVCFWEHIPTGDVITTGEQCARETMEVPSRLLLDQKRLRETAAARRAAVRERKEVEERQEIMRETYPDAYEILFDYKGENPFIRDVAARFGRLGYLSEKQASAIVQAHKRDSEPKPDEPEPQPCPEGKKITVEGTVIKTDAKDNGFGVRFVMTVKSDEGWVVWGTEPSAITDAVGELFNGQLNGCRVRFVADVERSDRDDFGFFKKPRKAVLLGEEG